MAFDHLRRALLQRFEDVQCSRCATSSSRVPTPAVCLAVSIQAPPFKSSIGPAMNHHRAYDSMSMQNSRNICMRALGGMTTRNLGPLSLYTTTCSLDQSPDPRLATRHLDFISQSFLCKRAHFELPEPICHVPVVELRPLQVPRPCRPTL
ncbi:hypothetical protein L227DRAFT_272848 [Lentinus tigrinus ALCF2SS1-6]|uniref:Uncharacterized protein n=1 Tax=Lentinus tigrinus ALCF2SS1-6 TaxID=1328759 RepID=A0A5C2SP81_9APHY|nr:hypothetical protein L227DRAFT_272848 [Lentinus tigrinus ALCF2SS1-6]